MEEKKLEKQKKKNMFRVSLVSVSLYYHVWRDGRRMGCMVILFPMGQRLASFQMNTK